MRVLWSITAAGVLAAAPVAAADGADTPAPAPAPVLQAAAAAGAIDPDGSATEATPWIIETEHEYVYDFETDMFVATNGVTIRYGPTTLSAQNATFSSETGEVRADGNVRLDRYGALWTGEVLRYNLLTGQMSGEGFKTGDPPFFASGEVLVADQTADVYVLADGAVTTDDYVPPSATASSSSQRAAS
jgi:lipopolysaccharide assembly outer membrane protein LptD (OstA)